MIVDPKTETLSGVRYVHSPHCDDRPPDMAMTLVVIHGISLPPEQFGGPAIEQLFLGQLDPAGHPYFAEIAGLRVSAHLLIRRDGSMVQFVPFTRRAWHAGESRLGDRTRCNDFSIGIELEGTDTHPYTSVQYDQLTQVLAALKQRYPSLRDVRGHSAIAPGRKTDPGPAFDWGRLANYLPSGLSLA
ncbi:N-acetyl-anhydromuranmyl-L-alanine amidase [Halothiobacillus diazotrophicus]|uniref:1,6-anhydro-N-acetylmuramyl-L-alanine amidase AmpD n=1 Tax=Halothiobacillus diazotrophicus TaxID=1860122 RepID=A0A191ZJ42_9GAMM|nr:1,6-anhydro-N-acetylmuramyl-L-alanine amidase AmpD [Halothiobacillus diazotrophicus]ANJ67909.1 N-acetyl-anhydromuranmyl-L-alanine amidase [Halothiobacillus diazotrophicus]